MSLGIDSKEASALSWKL